MNQEIERKFLLRDERWRALGQGMPMRQGYLCTDPDRVVRVRVAGDAAFLTIKSRMVGVTRSEWEYPLPLDEAQTLLDTVCIRPIIDKLRYRIAHAGMVWEVDEFFGENAGLVVAEIELAAEDQPFDKPDWIGAEVTHDVRYFNANLLRHPYRDW
jgi:adenylate cyclase